MQRSKAYFLRPEILGLKPSTVTRPCESPLLAWTSDPPPLMSDGCAEDRTRPAAELSLDLNLGLISTDFLTQSCKVIALWSPFLKTTVYWAALGEGLGLCPNTCEWFFLVWILHGRPTPPFPWHQSPFLSAESSAKLDHVQWRPRHHMVGPKMGEQGEDTAAYEIWCPLGHRREQEFGLAQ
ncbi:hypothetical protein TREES_T100017005 [Tupaia chinensis]|uniref:Uncharacterized protein n=1 Tax=Tupaia chinensis TaxID=246437 RepID=L9KZE6_TUPCH|nr:hypothetical protein TREES_T100017005 [Tupaia chinensis]